MGRRGPIRQSIGLKVLNGTAHKIKGQTSPQLPPIAPKCPAWLPAAAKRKWKELVPELEQSGCFARIDGESFGMLLLHWHNAIEAQKILNQEGLITVDERGLSRKHPANQILKENSASFKTYLTEFGLSPAARARLTLTAASEEGDEMEELLSRAKARRRHSEE